MRDYVGRFVLAGRDSAVEALLEFFADRVDYFGDEGVGTARIRRDLARYDREWPTRRFWLAGGLKVERLGGNRIRVIFPVGYELANRDRHASGRVMKTLVLQESSPGNLKITGVDERKL